MIEQNYRGFLLAAHPKRPDPHLRKGVVLVLDHDQNGAIGLQINKPFTNDVTFETVMRNVGLPCPRDYPLYHGGPEHANRIHVIHTLDWYSPSTVKVTDQIGVSNDISVLAAISESQGPECFRVVAGYTSWPPGHLLGEIKAEDPWTINHSWTFIPADIDMLFDRDDIDQWHNIISESGRIQVSSWF
jgi:putative transcriptional regulator